MVDSRTARSTAPSKSRSSKLSPRPPREPAPRAVPAVPGEVPYAELHAHTNFSFLDGASHPEELVETAVRCEQAGAGLIHVHVRDPDDGHAPTLDPVRLRDTVQALRDDLHRHRLGNPSGAADQGVLGRDRRHHHGGTAVLKAYDSSTRVAWVECRTVRLPRSAAGCR